MKSELLPCPFCGSSDLKVVISQIHEDLISIYCKTLHCITQQIFLPKEEATKRWNTRTPSQPLGKGKEKFQKLDGETINNFMKEIVPEDMLGKFDRNFIAYKIAEHFGG